MSKLNIDQKTIKDLLTAKKSDFLIPDYQRPYAWTEDECSTLIEADDFTEKDIEDRTKNIIDTFVDFLDQNGLIL